MTDLTRRNFLRQSATIGGVASVSAVFGRVCRAQDQRQPAADGGPPFFKTRGVRSITSFAVFIDTDYIARFGQPTFVKEYGRALRDYRPG